jgi:hypothetical protein
LDEVLHVDARGAVEAPWSPFISSQGKFMQSNIVQTEAIQPFVKLAQSNMELWSKFSQSPEVMAEATRNVKSFMEQAQTSTASLAGSNAFTGLMQGMVKNYTDFVSELTQSVYAMMSQGQATFLQQTQAAASNVIDAADARTRRSRHAA